VSARGPFEPDAARMYDDADRQEQLGRLQHACEQLSQLFEQRNPSDAVAYRIVADGAREAGVEQWAHSKLKVLVGRVPGRPEWLDPRNPGYDMPRDDWFEAVSSARSSLDRVTLELRALGTYD
jgi:hypothetical protein